MSGNTEDPKDLPQGHYQKTEGGFQITITTPSGESVTILFSEPEKDAAE